MKLQRIKKFSTISTAPTTITTKKYCINKAETAPKNRSKERTSIMRFTCQQQTLSKAITTVSKAIGARTTIQALKGILLTADQDNTLTLTASDMDFSIETKIEVQVQEPGQIIIMAKLFQDIIRKISYETVEISSDDEQKIEIRTATSDFNIIGMSADEFPGTGKLEENPIEFTFNKNVFRNMISKTQFCVSSDEARGILMGILVEIGENQLSMVSMDGYRVAVVKEDVQNQNTASIVIHGRIMNEISKILQEKGDEDENIRFLLGEKKAVIILENTKITTKLMEGKFIDYKSIMQVQKNTEIVISKDELSDSIERASLLAKEGKNNLIIFDIEDDRLTIRSTSEEGRVKEELSMDKTGADLEIGFNSKYVLDSLKVIDDEEVIMDMNTPTSACIMRPVEGDSYEYLILPVRIPVAY